MRELATPPIRRTAQSKYEFVWEEVYATIAIAIVFVPSCR